MSWYDDRIYHKIAELCHEGPLDNLSEVQKAFHYAPSGDGPLALEWKDKPHRLVYQLLRIWVKLEIQLADEQKRADSNFQSCERIKAKFEQSFNEAKQLRIAFHDTRAVLGDIQSMCKWIPGMTSDHYRWTPAQGVRVDDAMKQMQAVISKYTHLATAPTEN